ncbi:MAG: type IV pilus twitching motility protein PilT [Planctomycetota bacterium]
MGQTAHRIVELLQRAREVGASDLHVGALKPPMIRIGGRLEHMGDAPMKAAAAKETLFSLLSEKQRTRAEAEMTLEICVTADGSRYRVCFIKHRLGWDACFHVIPQEIPALEDLGLPDACRRLTTHRNGLVLIAGPRGSGKTTTLAALLNVVNEDRADHIITVEDPVEYMIPDKKSIVSQRAVGQHTESFAAALRGSLREDPDVIAIGELRDPETIGMAVTAAETGHLVLASLHTGSAIGSITRLIEAFPPDQQPQIRTMLAESIRGVIVQRLLPRRGTADQVLALELMIGTPGTAGLIRENRLYQLRSAIQMGKKQGMRLLDESLYTLVRKGLVTRAVAARLAEQPERLPDDP